MTMSPPPENELPLETPRRPTSLTVVSIIGIAMGALGITCIGGGATFSLIRTDPTMEHAPAWFMVSNLAVIVVSVMISMFILIGSVGLLNLRPWARTMMLV